MKDLILLQFRKNRLTFCVIAAALLISLPLAVLLKPQGLKASESAATAMLYWLFAGIPLAALIFSCGAGAEAAREKAALTEELLPVPQYRLLLSALLTAFIASAVLSLAAGLGALAGFPSEGPRALYGFMLPYYAFALAFLTLYGFTLSYAFANGIAGGALAITALTAIGTPLVLMDAFQEVHYKLLPLASLKALLAAMAIAGGAYALKLFSERGSRAASGGRKLALIAAAVLAAPVAVTFLMLARFNSRAEAVIMPAPAYTGFARYNTFPDPDIFNGAAMFQRPFTGELFLADPAGKKTVMVQGSTDREKGFLYLSPYMRPYRTVIAAKDGYGKAWVLYGATAALTRVFNGDINGFAEYPSASYNYGLTLSLAKKKGLLNFRADGSYFADLKPGMKDLQWRKVGRNSGEGARYLMDMESQDVYLRADRRTGVLSYKGHSWKLPSGGAAVPVPLKGSKEMAFIVNTGAHKPSYLCLPGAKAAEFAPRAVTPDMNLYLNPDDSVWTSDISEIRVTGTVSGESIDRGSMVQRFHVLTSDRKTLEVKLHTLLAKARVPAGSVQVLHAEGGRVWFNLGDKYMASVDSDGEGAAKLWKFPTRLVWRKAPPDWSSVTSSEKGLFIAGADGLFFMDWEGRVNKIS